MSKVFKAISSLVSKILPSTKMPKIETPFMPDPGSTSARLAARKKMDAKKQTGREGTIYTNKSAYGGLNLGGTS